MSTALKHRPFLKWPGGKFRLLNFIKPHIPASMCLVEPFVGAGALFLNTDCEDVIANDINPDLINLYTQLKQDPSTFIQKSSKYFSKRNNSEHRYYQLRDKFNLSKNTEEKSALFLYLNRHGYNGLCRYNSKGYYNVPFGDYKKPYFPFDELTHFSKIAAKTNFHCQDFVSFLQPFLKYDNLKKYIFYCDPPYVPLNKTSNFTAYARSPFTLEQQDMLAQIAEKLSKKGASVIISNHDVPYTRGIYKKAKIKKLRVRRSISCKGKKRRKASELLAIF